MKKGCFLTVIISLTLLILAVFYMIRFHGEDLLEVGTEKLVEFAQSKIERDIEKLEDNSYGDSLNVFVSKYFSELNKLDIEVKLELIEELADDFEVIFMDSIIDSAEFDFITNRLGRHEQRKEN